MRRRRLEVAPARRIAVNVLALRGAAASVLDQAGRPPAAAELLRQRRRRSSWRPRFARESAGRAPVRFDGATLPFADASFTIWLLSHVLNRRASRPAAGGVASRGCRRGTARRHVAPRLRAGAVGHSNCLPASLRRVQSYQLECWRARCAPSRQARVIWRWRRSSCAKSVLLRAAPARGARRSLSARCCAVIAPALHVRSGPRRRLCSSKVAIVSASAPAGAHLAASRARRLARARRSPDQLEGAGRGARGELEAINRSTDAARPYAPRRRRAPRRVDAHGRAFLKAPSARH